MANSFESVKEELAVARAIILFPPGEDGYMNRVALFRRQPLSSRRGGQWECSGGQLDDVEKKLSPEAAFGVARHREVLEETGLEIDRLLPDSMDYPIEWVIDDVPGEDSKDAITKVAVTKVAGPQDIVLNPSEVDAFVLPTYPEALGYNLTDHSREGLKHFGKFIMSLPPLPWGKIIHPTW